MNYYHCCYYYYYYLMNSAPIPALAPDTSSTRTLKKQCDIVGCDTSSPRTRKKQRDLAFFLPLALGNSPGEPRCPKSGPAALSAGSSIRYGGACECAITFDECNTSCYIINAAPRFGLHGWCARRAPGARQARARRVGFGGPPP